MNVAQILRLRRGARRAVIAAVVSTLALGGVELGLGLRGAPMRTITATFAQAPGLYAGNHVDVLSIPVGTVVSVKPLPAGVEVRMKVKKHVHLPANVKAVLAAPQAVSDRFIALTPVYNGGPQLPDGAHLPLARTSEPLSLDQVLGSINNLVQALGPSMTNRNGALSQLIDDLNAQLAQAGQPLHNTVGTAAQALTGLAADTPQINQTLDNMSSLVTALANDATTYQSFTGDLAAVSTELADDRGALGGALSDLQQVLAQVTTFIQHNQASIGANLSNLQSAVGAVASQQQQLAAAVNLLPLTVQNLGQVVQPGKQSVLQGGPTIAVRYNPTNSSLPLVKRTCGSNLIRFGRVFQNGSTGSAFDLACALAAVVATIPQPPGATNGPDLSLPAIYAAQQRPSR